MPDEPQPEAAPNAQGLVLEEGTQHLNPEKLRMVGDARGAPTIYADAIRGSMVMPQIVKINLVEHRVIPENQELVTVRVATIIVPPGQIRGWADYFAKMADDMERDQLEEEKLAEDGNVEPTKA